VLGGGGGLGSSDVFLRATPFQIERDAKRSVEPSRSAALDVDTFEDELQLRRQQVLHERRTKQGARRMADVADALSHRLKIDLQ